MADQPYPNRFKTAIELQDACNLRAIARKLVEAADAAADAGGTQASYNDPAVILIVRQDREPCEVARRGAIK